MIISFATLSAHRWSAHRWTASVVGSKAATAATAYNASANAAKCPLDTTVHRESRVAFYVVYTEKEGEKKEAGKQ